LLHTHVLHSTPSIYVTSAFFVCPIHHGEHSRCNVFGFTEASPVVTSVSPEGLLAHFDEQMLEIEAEQRRGDEARAASANAREELDRLRSELTKCQQDLSKTLKRATQAEGRVKEAEETLRRCKQQHSDAAAEAETYRWSVHAFAHEYEITPHARTHTRTCTHTHTHTRTLVACNPAEVCNADCSCFVTLRPCFVLVSGFTAAATPLTRGVQRCTPRSYARSYARSSGIAQ